MEKYLKINRDEALLINSWFLCVASEGFDREEDHELVTRIKEFIEKEEEKQEDG